jgi:hypothetical protein
VQSQQAGGSCYAEFDVGAADSSAATPSQTCRLIVPTVWDFNGAAAGGPGSGANGRHAHLECASGWPPTFEPAPGHASHYGLSTHPDACGANDWSYCASSTAITGGYDNGASMSMAVYARAPPPPASAAGSAAAGALPSGSDPAVGSVCHYAPVCTERAQRYIRITAFIERVQTNIRTLMTDSPPWARSDVQLYGEGVGAYYHSILPVLPAAAASCIETAGTASAPADHAACAAVADLDTDAACVAILTDDTSDAESALACTYVPGTGGAGTDPSADPLLSLWGGKSSALSWRIEYDGALTSGSDVHLYGKGAGQYLHSGGGEGGGGVAWGAKDNAGNGWRLEWEGALASGTAVHLFGKGSTFTAGGAYFHSNSLDGGAFSWGDERRGGLAWRLEWDADIAPLRHCGEVAAGLGRTVALSYPPLHPMFTNAFGALCA